MISKEYKLSPQDRAARTNATLRLLGNGGFSNETQVLLTWLYMILDDIESGKVEGRIEKSHSDVRSDGIRFEEIKLITRTRTE